MSRGVNKAIVVGHLGQDPNFKTSAAGVQVCRFSVATDERWKDASGAEQSRTEWHNIVTFGRTAEACGQYLTRGRLVYVEGRMQTREWETDGVKHRRTEIVALDVQFLGGPKTGDETTPAPRATKEPHAQPAPDADMPF